MRPNAIFLGGALVLGACASDPPPSPSLPNVPDDKPYVRLTAAQYDNTVADLFAPAQLDPAALPFELRIGAFNNNVEVTTATSTLVEAYHTAALTVSGRVMQQLDGLLGCERGDRACGHQYLSTLAERAFRRPLTEAERTELLADFDAWMDAHDFDTALELSLQIILQSPDFLYVIESGRGTNADGDVMLSSWEVASRLSYFLWNSMPDDALFERARRGELETRGQVAAEALRMMRDDRAHRSVMRFHRQLFDLESIGNNGIDPDYHPYFVERYGEDDPSDVVHLDLQPAMRWESEIFVDKMIFEGEGTLRSLLTSNRTWVEQGYAWIYGIEGELEGEPVTWRFATAGEYEEDDEEEGGGSREYYAVDLDPTQRAGVLTHVGWLHSHANPQQPSPVHRGVAVLHRLLCKELSAPTDVPALETTNAGQEPKTNRDRYAIHTENPACKGCHEQIDGIGFAFEAYDSLGHWRTEDNGYPVDSTGKLVGTDQDGPVSGAVELMTKLGDSRSVHDCYVRQWHRYALGRNETAADEPYLTALSEGFWNAGGYVPELMINIAASYGFRHRKAK